MGRIKTGEINEMKLDMTPMIDVIFQLLIFFMCSLKFKSLEGKLASYLPKDVGLQNSIVASPKLDEVRIKLIHDKSAPPQMMQTRIMVTLTAGRKVDIADWDNLTEDIRVRYEQLKSLDVPFIIDPQPLVPLQAVTNALNACRKAGVKDVRFAAKSAIDRPLE
jgi:biopolymer transport protein ExbD